MKDILKIIAVVILAVAVIAIAVTITKTENLKSGIVIRKSHTPSRGISQPIISMVQGHTRIIPRVMIYSEKWEIMVQSGKKTEWWDVSQEVYNETEIGDRVNR